MKNVEISIQIVGTLNYYKIAKNRYPIFIKFELQVFTKIFFVYYIGIFDIF